MGQAVRRWSTREQRRRTASPVTPERLRNLKLLRTFESDRSAGSNVRAPLTAIGTASPLKHNLRYLSERPRPPLDAELRVAELAVAGVGGRQPLLQAALVHRAQRARAVARGQQPLADASFVTNTADGAVAERGGARGEKRKDPDEVWTQEIKDPLCKQLETREGPAIVLMVDFLPHFSTTLNTVCVFHVLKATSPLRARGFEHRGQQASVQRRDLGDVQRLAPVAPALLHILPQVGAAGAVTEGAGQVATAPRRHGCGGLDGESEKGQRSRTSTAARWLGSGGGTSSF